MAIAHKLVYGVKAHIGSLAPRPKAAAKLIGYVPGLTLTLDLHFHARGGCRGRLQERFARNTIDYGRIVDVMGQTGYRGWLGIEYVWIDWDHCNECDNLSETILFRDFFRSLTS